MESSYAPVTSGIVPSLQTLQLVVSPTSTPQSNANGTGVSTASIVSIAFFLILFTLIALGVVCWIRKSRRTPKVVDGLKVSGERQSEKEAAHDVEAVAASRPIVPITPLPDVRWTPQVRSISGPVPGENTGKMSTSTFPKRPRSPPPPNYSKNRGSFLDPYPKSAPAHSLSFSQHEIAHPLKSPRGAPSPPPLALAVSGMETRSLGRTGSGPRN